MLALATLKAVLELSPLKSNSVPPDRTGLAPTKVNPMLIPLEIVETPVPPDDEPDSLLEVQMLHAVISKFQMPDSAAVSVNKKV